jgi:hypothetical protein
MDPKTLDKRLQRLLVRDGQVTSEEVERAAEKLQDLSDRIATPSDEELEALRDALPAEQAARKERIRVAVERYYQESHFPPEPEPELEPEPDADTEPEV